MLMIKETNIFVTYRPLLNVLALYQIGAIFTLSFIISIINNHCRPSHGLHKISIISGDVGTIADK